MMGRNGHVFGDRRQFLGTFLASTAFAGWNRIQGAGGDAAPVSKQAAAVLQRLKGPMASVTMPYKEDFSLDLDSLRKWVAFMCERKIPVLFMTLGDSELDVL